jgi:hypothetical protein
MDCQNSVSNPRHQGDSFEVTNVLLGIKDAFARSTDSHNPGILSDPWFYLLSGSTFNAEAAVRGMECTFLCPTAPSDVLDIRPKIFTSFVRNTQKETFVSLGNIQHDIF